MTSLSATLLADPANLVRFLQNEEKNRQLGSGILGAFLRQLLTGPVTCVMSVRPPASLSAYISPALKLRHPRCVYNK